MQSHGQRTAALGVPRSPSATWFADRLHWIVFLATVAICEIVAKHTYRVYMDDVFVTLRYAWNFAHGQGFVFNQGQRVLGTTAPLWALTVGAAARLSHVAVTRVAKGLSMLCLGTGAAALWIWLYPRVSYFAIVSIPLLFFNPIVTLNVGGEIPAAILLAVIWGLLMERRAFGWSILVGTISFMVRGDGGLLPVLTVAIMAAEWARKGEPLRAWCTRQRAHLRGVVCASMAFLVWETAQVAYFHELLPATLHAKLIQGASGLWTLYLPGLPHAVASLAPAIILVVAGLGLVTIPLTAWILPLWVAAFTAAYSVLRVPDYQWYYYPLVVALCISVPFGLRRIARVLLLRSTARQLIAASSVCAFLVSLPSAQTAPPSARYVAYTYFGNWLRTHAPTASVGTNEIGILGYTCHCQIDDVLGLVSKHYSAADLFNWNRLVVVHNPGFLMIPYIPTMPLTETYGNGATEALYTKVASSPTSFPAYLYQQTARVTLARVAWPPSATPAQPQLLAGPTRSPIGGDIAFAGYGVRPIANGVDLFEFYFRDLSPTNTPKQFFVHLVSTDHAGVWFPLGSTPNVPTSDWRPGWTYAVPVLAEVPPDHYQVLIGWASSTNANLRMAIPGTPDNRLPIGDLNLME